MIDAGELRKGIAIELDDNIYQIIEYRHIKIGRGSAQLRLRLRVISVSAIPLSALSRQTINLPLLFLNVATFNIFIMTAASTTSWIMKSYEQISLTTEQLERQGIT